MTQADRVLAHLRHFGSITPKESMELYGVMRLGARIYDLKRQGFDIRTTRETARNRFGERTTYARYVWGGTEHG